MTNNHPKIASLLSQDKNDTTPRPAVPPERYKKSNITTNSTNHEVCSSLPQSDNTTGQLEEDDGNSTTTTVKYNLKLNNHVNKLLNINTSKKFLVENSDASNEDDQVLPGSSGRTRQQYGGTTGNMAIWQYVNPQQVQEGDSALGTVHNKGNIEQLQEYDIDDTLKAAPTIDQDDEFGTRNCRIR